MMKEGTVEAAGRVVGRGRRATAFALIVVLLPSWLVSLFIYRSLNAAFLSPTPLPTRIIPTVNTHSHPSNIHTHITSIHSHTTDIHSHITNIHSHDTNTYVNATNTVSHATNTVSHTTNTHSHTADTHSHTTNTHSHTTNTHSHTTNTHSHTTNTHSHNTNTPSHATAIYINATKTHSHTTNTHANALNNDTNNIDTLSNNTNTHTNSTNIHAYVSTTSTSHPRDQSQRLSTHTVSSVPLAGSDIQCGEQYQEEGPRRQVVLWTPFWHSWKGWKEMIRHHGRLREGRCPTWRCEFLWGPEVTMAQVADADAVIFFSLDVLSRPLPPRSPHAVWIWLEMEAPPISRMAKMAWTQMEQEGVFFNITMSYHHLNPVIILPGQFVPLSTPQHCPLPSTFYLDTSSPAHTSYSHHMQEFDAWLRENGEVVDARLRAERDKRHGGLTHKPGDKTIIPEPLPDDYSEKKVQNNEGPSVKYGELTLTAQEIAWATRPRLAVWMASHCPTNSQREALVAALRRFMAITTVGKCGELTCGKNHMDTYCFRWLAASHLFYFSFENALCDDYHTEKLWLPLEHGMVPVVYGGQGYRHTLPFDSYIEVSNFTSAAALATHLLYLATHPSAYLRHLQWRRHWWVQWPVPWCGLCTVLHSQTHPVRTTMEHWWNNTATCYDPPSW